MSYSVVAVSYIMSHPQPAKSVVHPNVGASLINLAAFQGTTSKSPVILFAQTGSEGGAQAKANDDINEFPCKQPQNT
eukprot:1143174-Pelagomonas_calceolata.AAC.1